MTNATTRLLLIATSSMAITVAAHAQQSPATTSPTTNATGETLPPAVTTSPTTAASDGGATLEEIVVTAQRRAENLQSVPLAVTALTAATITKLGVTTPQDIVQLVPGTAFNRQAQGAAPFIRGVGNASTFVGNEPSVAIFLDDIYIPTGNAAIFEFNNISSVEVLKGPQGTLFGRNATGGVIHIHTRDPEQATHVDASVGYGNYNTYTGNIYATTGITENIAVNVSAFIANQDDGWGKNIITGSDAYTGKGRGIAGKILFEPDDLTSIRLGATYSRRKSDEGMATRPTNGYRGRNGYSPEANGAGFYDAVTNFDQYYITNYYNFSAKAQRELGFAKLVSITAYGVSDAFAAIDIDASPQRYVDAPGVYRGKTFTQELQLLSNSDSAFQWIIGGFYLKDFAYVNLNFLGLPYGANINHTRGTQKTDSLSGFAQGTYEIFDRTKLTAGVRYTTDKRSEFGFSEFRNASYVLLPAPRAPTNAVGFKDSHRWNAVTGRVSLDHKFTDDVMGYIAYNRGFKSGVYNLPGFSTGTTIALPPVNPETINAYTAGFKSEFADHKVRLNVEGFWYDYKNIQIQNNVPVGAGTILVNGGAARLKGIDADLTLQPVRNLTINANMSYVHGRYTKFDNGPTFFPLAPNAPRAIPAGCNFTTYPVGAAGSPMVQIIRSATDPRSCSLAGNKTVNTPPLSTTLAVLYHIPADFGGVDLSASWAHGGNYYFEPDNLSFTHQPHTNLVNATIKWTPFDGNFDITVYGANLTDQKYYSYIANSGTSGTKSSAAAPRTYGVRVGAHF